MALTGYQRPLQRQPGGLVRINERHWLARDLLFAHSGVYAFVWHRITPESVFMSSDVVQSAQNPALDHTRGWKPGSSRYGQWDIPVRAAHPLTLSAWHTGVAGVTNDPLVSVVTSGAANGQSLRRTGAEFTQAYSINTASNSFGNATTGFVASQWQHAAAVFTSSTSRAAYCNGGNKGSNSDTRAVADTLNAVQIARDPTPTLAGVSIQGIALPIVIARTLDDEEVAFLHAEQRSNPWLLFAERPVWVPVSVSVTSGLVLTSGTFTRKPAVAPGDAKVYLTSTGAWAAKTTPASGDRLIDLSAGAFTAGAPA